MKHEILADGIEIYCADCLDVMRDMPDKSVDAVITDLPYGSTRMEWDSIIPLIPMWEITNRILKKTANFITTSSQPFTSTLVNSNIENFKYEMIWNKKLSGNFLNASFQPLKIHENILVFSLSPATFSKNNENAIYNPIMEKKDFRKSAKSKAPQYIGWNSSGKYEYTSNGGDKAYPKSIIEISNANRNTTHPTQKPVELYKYLIATYSNENDIVLDICMGSGTTGVACAQLGRRFVGIELDPDYYEIAKKRIKEALMQPRLFDTSDTPDSEVNQQSFLE